jgi:ABC-type transporter Mla subunit MlaD
MNEDMMKPFEAVKSMMTMQADVISKTVAQQQKTAQALSSFFQDEAKKAQDLKSPEDVIKFNMDSNKALLDLLQVQGTEFTSIAEEARDALMKEVQSMTPFKG